MVNKDLSTMEKAEQADKKIQELSAIERAEELAKKLEAENRKFEDLVERNERARTELMLAGRSNLGIPLAPKRKMTDLEYAKAYRAGKVKLNEPVPEVDA